MNVPCERFLAADAGGYLERSGFTFPILVRSAGFHNGRFFERIDCAGDLAETVAPMPTDDLLAIAYHDMCSSDGVIRKFRVTTIGGALYPVHLAISRAGNVHYVSSAMQHIAAMRDEEAAFLNDMPAYLGERAMRALESIAATIALDYGGIDFRLAPDGRVVVFEANAAMAIFVPDADPRWDYRRAPMGRALQAAAAMLAARAREKKNAAPVDSDPRGVLR